MMCAITQHPGLGHEDLEEREDLVDWMLAHRRDAAPRHVRLRTTDLGAASAYWLRIDRIDAPVKLIVADAEFVRPGVVRVDTDNAAEVPVGSTGL